MENKSPQEKCAFLTSRLYVESWQNINTLSAARKWIEARDQEACFLTIYSNDDNTIIGFISLYEDINWSDQSLILLRFGYLISEANWNQGFGTEVLQGLLTWCQSKKISFGYLVESELKIFHQQKS